MHIQKSESFASKLLHAIMLESADTVQFLQDREIVHCDIKPHNILFNWFVDFDCVKSFISFVLELT